MGCDTHGYAYRSGGGEKVHAAKREPYGAAFREGDVVGMYLSLGAPGQRKARAAALREALLRGAHLNALRQELVRAAGQLSSQLFSVERERRRTGGSAVAFAVNGVSQGVAYSAVAGGAPAHRRPSGRS